MGFSLWDRPSKSSEGARKATEKLLLASFTQQKEKLSVERWPDWLGSGGLPEVWANGNRGGRGFHAWLWDSYGDDSETPPDARVLLQHRLRA